MKKEVSLDTEQPTQNNTRGWLFDALMECGQKLAMVNHLEEKVNGLIDELSREEDTEKAFKLADKLANMNNLVQNISDDRRALMDYVMEVAGASDEERCLLKHALLDYTIACELYETNTADSRLIDNMKHTSETLAGAISLTLGIEFKTCLRCLEDKLKK